MGSLPVNRIEPSRPFHVCGVGYAGPFILLQIYQRGGSSIKAYVSIFVCFANKAVHFEVISDLTSSGFLAALKRFVARRGKCYKIFSDNGTNFVGAHNEIKEIESFLKKMQLQLKVIVLTKICNGLFYRQDLHTWVAYGKLV